MRKLEHKLQKACIEWFRLQYPRLYLNIFSIPNGSKRDVISGYYYKSEGLTSGVSDIFIAVPSGLYGGLFVEFKSFNGRQTESQRAFERAVTGHYRYAIVRDIEYFIELVTDYFNG